MNLTQNRGKKWIKTFLNRNATNNEKIEKRKKDKKIENKNVKGVSKSVKRRSFKAYEIKG